MIRIIGAGMAGLLAGAMFRDKATVFERAPEIPNNHHALLRFREDHISRNLNIPFKPVSVIKIIKPWRNQIADAINYSLKSNGTASVRSSVTADGSVQYRWIAPTDFIQRMAEMQRTGPVFNVRVDRAWIDREKASPIISTMPMPALMDLLDYEHKPEFSYRHGWVIRGEVDLQSDFCGTIYYPDPSSPVVRATLTGTLLQIELSSQYDPNDARWSVDVIAEEVMYDFGIDRTTYSAELKSQQYAKINPIDERDRRRFIIWATDKHNIYSLGRFAVWKPGLLLDDVYTDVQRIQRLINHGHNYEGRLK